MKKICLDKKVCELHESIRFDTHKDAYIGIVEAFRGFWGCGAEVVSAEIYAPKSFYEIVEPLGNSNFPVNWICPLDEDAQPTLAGIHFVAVAGTEVKFVKTSFGAKAAVYEDENNVYCRTFGIYSQLGNGDPYAHTHSNLEQLESVLNECGFKWTDAVRTWFYNDDILAWYPDFNRARTEFFKNRKTFDGLLPASTGIGAPNPAGKKMESGVFAIKSKSGKRGGDADFVSELPSPLQGGATSYGSSFSRAIEIFAQRSNRIMISGTASIDAEGKTANVGDIAAQVRQTLAVIEGILKSRGMGFENTINSVVYCLRPEYLKVFDAWNKEHKIPFCPSNSTVCRSDLLFEIELEAAVNKQ